MATPKTSDRTTGSRKALLADPSAPLAVSAQTVVSSPIMTKHMTRAPRQSARTDRFIEIAFPRSAPEYPG
jgi:hypothetical protein